MSTNIDGVIACVTYLLAISAGAQGVTEMVKNAIPWLSIEKVPQDPENQKDVSEASRLEGYRQGALKIIATASAMFLIQLAGLNPLHLLTGNETPLSMTQTAAWGFVSSFGSPFLNQILKILISIRDTRNSLINKKSPCQKVYGTKKTRSRGNVSASG